MLSRLGRDCGLHLKFSKLNSIRQFSFNLPRFARYTRESLRDRLHLKKDSFKDAENNFNVNQSDSIPLRPASHLLKCVGFTVGSGFLMYYTAAYFEIQRAIRETHRYFDPQNIFSDFKKLLNNSDSRFEAISVDDPRVMLQRLSPSQRCILTLIAVNCLVSLMWRVKPIEPFMWRYFTNSFASKSLCTPMFLSIFSHKLFLHLALNMYVLWSFAPVTIGKFLGIEHFLAFYCTGGLVSSLSSLTHKCAISSPIRALGASGAILAVLVYACMKMPDARLSIVFLPMFHFSAENAVYGIIFFDLLGLLFGFRVFDHAAHLGGALFGLFYATYGEEYYRKHFRPAIMRAFNEAQKRKPE